MTTCSAEISRYHRRRVLDERYNGIEAVASSWPGRPRGLGESLRCRPPGGEKWGSHLRDTMRDGGGGTPESHHLHARDTGDIPRKRCVCGTTESGNPKVSDSCEMQEEDPASVEDREEMVLRIP
jgi:hypothetical protein